MNINKLKMLLTTSMAIVTLATPLVPSLSSVVYASDSENQKVTQVNNFEDKTIAELMNDAQLRYSSSLPNTPSTQNSIATAFEKKVMNMTVKDVKNNINDLMKEFDGASYNSRAVAGVGGKLQNGGWNMYYNTSTGKTSVYNFYDRLVMGAGGSVLYSAILDALAVTCGITVAGAVIVAICNLIAGELVRKTASARGLVSSHGNTGTVRVTLTDELWSSKYNASW
ncbi:hypothetical protein PM729_00850 [Enterococcus mundtii]|uniref:hypothetical protein n=1 Tax=Enterococcus mundtii TaxID=53346 RepID=UPI0023304E06|nr:hypothetical protein [Enterococcus mundtii]MDB7086236.1 hypothetical protein [Enterococcus mundtii]